MACGFDTREQWQVPVDTVLIRGEIFKKISFTSEIHKMWTTKHTKYLPIAKNY